MYLRMEFEVGNRIAVALPYVGGRFYSTVGGQMMSEKYQTCRTIGFVTKRPWVCLSLVVSVSLAAAFDVLSVAATFDLLVSVAAACGFSYLCVVAAAFDVLSVAPAFGLVVSVAAAFGAHFSVAAFECSPFHVYAVQY